MGQGDGTPGAGGSRQNTLPKASAGQPGFPLAEAAGTNFLPSPGLDLAGHRHVEQMLPSLLPGHPLKPELNKQRFYVVARFQSCQSVKVMWASDSILTPDAPPQAQPCPSPPPFTAAFSVGHMIRPPFLGTDRTLPMLRTLQYKPSVRPSATHFTDEQTSQCNDLTLTHPHITWGLPARQIRTQQVWGGPGGL